MCLGQDSAPSIDNQIWICSRANLHPIVLNGLEDRDYDCCCGYVGRLSK